MLAQICRPGPLYLEKDTFNIPEAFTSRPCQEVLNLFSRSATKSFFEAAPWFSAHQIGNQSQLHIKNGKSTLALQGYQLRANI